MSYFLMQTVVGLTVVFSAITPQVQTIKDTVTTDMPTYVNVMYEEEFDYRAEMYKCAVIGGEDALCFGSILEKQRNAKLIAMEKYDEVTRYFEPGKSHTDIAIEMIADEMRKEYEVAGTVYEYLAKEGYSEVAIAAILGNMMNECGGNTLHFQPYIYDHTGLHYGLCQWNVNYGPQVNGVGVMEQLLYLNETIAKNMKQFGGSFEEFNNLEGAEYAGTYFCKYYERGANARQRGLNAIVAYEWIKGFK